MTKRRDLQLSAYGISKWRYRELLNFCLQYPEWVKELNHNALAHRHHKGSSSKTEENAAKNQSKQAELIHKCQLIEQSALEASGEFYPQILLAVTQEHASHKFLNMTQGLYCSEREFLAIKKSFFTILDRKRN